MAAKEPTVEELRVAAKALVAEVERLASERAWDEGWQAGAVDSEEAGYKRTTNPYRLPKGPTK